MSAERPGGWGVAIIGAVLAAAFFPAVWLMGASLAEHPGVIVQRRDGDRWRLLVDQERMPLAHLRALGMMPIADAPVTLEELFIGVGRA